MSATPHTLTSTEQKGYFTYPNGARFYGWFMINKNNEIVCRPVGVRARMNIGHWQEGMTFEVAKKPIPSALA